MKRNRLSLLVISPCILLCASYLSSCKKDSYPLGSKPTASFTVSPIAGKVNTYLLSSTSQNAFALQWNRDNGQGFKNGLVNDTVYYPSQGTYNVQLFAFGRGGIDTAAQSITVATDDPAKYFNLLTTRSWKLDGSADAKAVIVGTESNPSAYYPGGALLSCQADDLYTFSADSKLSYNANGSTQGGADVGYSCATDLSFSNIGFTYTLLPAGAGAIASIQLNAKTPAAFIGTIDGIDDNYYRLLSISASSMVIRGGNPSGGVGNTVFQYKFVAK
jgi:PKD repeat protein